MRKILVVFILPLILYSCGANKISKTINTYEEVEKGGTETITFTKKLITIKPIRNTQISQKKGTTTVSFQPSRYDIVGPTTKTNQEITFADPTKPGYDIYKVTTLEDYDVRPVDKDAFTVKVINGGNQPFKLSDVLVTKQMGGEDGSDWAANNFSKEWSERMIATKSSRDFHIDGVNNLSIKDGDIFYFKIDGMPTAFDKAGNIAERQTFEWWFQATTQDIKKEGKKTVEYQSAPIETRKCVRCDGKGHGSQLAVCPNCKGTGKGLLIGVCSKCNGTGMAYPTCDNCDGKGFLSYPKSQPRPVKSSVILNGWNVKIVTKPAGANIQIINPQTGDYVTQRGTSPLTISWLCKSGMSCPIIIESMGNKVKVLPINEKGKESNAINVDFTKGTPIIKGAQQVN